MIRLNSRYNSIIKNNMSKRTTAIFAHKFFHIIYAALILQNVIYISSIPILFTYS